MPLHSCCLPACYTLSSARDWQEVAALKESAKEAQAAVKAAEAAAKKAADVAGESKKQLEAQNAKQATVRALHLGASCASTVFACFGSRTDTGF